jgi:hypothetical protein
MIQRVQSIYLSLIALLSLLLFKGSFLVFSEKTGSVLRVTFTGIVRSIDNHGFLLIEKLFPISAIIFLIPLLSLVTIFFFKNRAVQIWFSKLLVGLISALILGSVFYSYLIITKYNVQLIPGIKMVLPLFQLILSILTLRGIRKDDQLVKSYDRLR